MAGWGKWIVSHQGIQGICSIYRNLVSFIGIVWKSFNFYLLIHILYLSILVVFCGPFIVCTYEVCHVLMESILNRHYGKWLRFSASYKMSAMIWFSHDIKGIGCATLPRDGKFISRAQRGRSSVFTMMILKGWRVRWNNLQSFYWLFFRNF